MASERRRSGRMLVALVVAAATGMALYAGSVAFMQAPPAEGQESSPLQRRELLARALALGVAPAAVAGMGGSEPAWASAKWSGRYRDPKHEGCLRQVKKVGGIFEITGTSNMDSSKKDCPDGAKTKPFYLEGTLPFNGLGFVDTSSDTMVIDFSSKGGPKDSQAKWDGNGIVFPDGNKWTKDKNRGYGGFVPANSNKFD